MSRRSRPKLGDITEAQKRTKETTERKSKQPNGKNDMNGAVSSNPVIIEVQGLREGNDDTKYVLAEMGTSGSKEADALDEEQTESLTKVKNDKNSNMEKDKNENNSTEKSGRDRNSENIKHKHNIENPDDKIETIGSTENKDDNKDSLTLPGKQESDSNRNNGKDGVDGKGEDDVIVTVAGKDDIDAASTYSLFMEKDFRYYFQHPYCRLFFAYFVVFCNFLIYAEDPVAHSIKECLIPMIGNDFAFVGTRYPPNAWSLLKVLLWLTGIVIGMIVGKLLVHGLLFNKLFRLKMFTDDQGSWMIMFLITLVTVFITSLIYNGFLTAGGDATAPYRISDLMGVSNDIFMKVAACGTWCGDFFTAWMVTDIMLQEKLYPGWARPIRRWWTKGWNRIILFWIVVFVSSFVVIFVIATDYIRWDKLNRDFLPTNELSRAFLASFILVMDILIVMQDWDFPHFMSAIDIKLPGVNTAHIRFSIPKFLKRESWQVHITGKWFNYGILFLVMILDMNMWKNQIFYYPYDYGQYTGPDHKIYTVQDQYSIDTFNETLTNFAYRNATINPNTGLTFVSTDTHMNSRYYGIALGVKAIAFFPSLIMFLVFGLLVWFFGRFKPSDTDPYAGRLKKRFKKKKRFSFRMPWKRKEEVRRKIHAVPKLLYFKRKAKDANGSEIEEKEIPSEGFSSDDKELKDDKDTEIEIMQRDKDKKSKRKLPAIPKLFLFWRKNEKSDEKEDLETSANDKDFKTNTENEIIVEQHKNEKARRKLPSVPKMFLFWKKKKDSDVDEEIEQTEIPPEKILIVKEKTQEENKTDRTEEIVHTEIPPAETSRKETTQENKTNKVEEIEHTEIPLEKVSSLKETTQQEKQTNKLEENKQTEIPLEKITSVKETIQDDNGTNQIEQETEIPPEKLDSGKGIANEENQNDENKGNINVKADIEELII